MFINKLNLVLLFTVIFSACCEPIPANYTVKWFKQKLDHFSYHSTECTFKQRYLISTDHFTSPDGPIFFYTGNEGDLFQFVNNTGFMWENAPKFGAMVIFMEHRYYGQSLPFGNDSFNPDKMDYLTVEQALADFAFFIDDFKQVNPNVANSPVVVFGGSYGGMLAAWFRMKYPHLTVGALASSAPIFAFPGLSDCGSFEKIKIADYQAFSPNCWQAIDNAGDVIAEVWSHDPKWLEHKFNLCAPLDHPDNLTQVIDTAAVYMAMVDYSNPSDFLAKPPNKFPANPVKMMCDFLTPVDMNNTDQYLTALYQAVSVYTNATDGPECLNVNASFNGLGDKAWDYQANTEMVLVTSCADSPQVGQDSRKMLTLFGGKNITAASNIIFSNGERDPWRGGGVLDLDDSSPSLVTIYIQGAAHHEDLRFSGPGDLPFLLNARQTEIDIITGWIKAYYRKKEKFL